jgi:hypothetical protein
MGLPHSNPDELYFLTKYGHVVGEGKTEWPTARRKGLGGAEPDPRQLTEAQLEHATWITDR